MKASARIDIKALLQYAMLYLCFLDTSSIARIIYGDMFIVFTFAIVVILVALKFVKLLKITLILVNQNYKNY